MTLSKAEYYKIEESLCRQIERRMEMGATHECATRWCLLNHFIKMGLVDKDILGGTVVICSYDRLVRINVEE